MVRINRDFLKAKPVAAELTASQVALPVGAPSPLTSQEVLESTGPTVPTVRELVAKTVDAVPTAELTTPNGISHPGDIALAPQHQWADGFSLMVKPEGDIVIKRDDNKPADATNARRGIALTMHGSHGLVLLTLIPIEKTAERTIDQETVDETVTESSQPREDVEGITQDGQS